MRYRTKDNHKTSTSQLVSFVRDSYLDRTSRPVYSLVYLLGFIVLYEVGTICINPQVLNQSLTDAKMVVSFVWGQNLLEHLGFSERATWIAMPLTVIVILLALQYTSRTRWYIRFKDFIPMTFECVLLAVPLIVLSLVVTRSVGFSGNTDLTGPGLSFRTESALPAMTTRTEASAPDTKTTTPTDDQPKSSLLVDLVTGIGAGIYEEFVFRLILICLLMFLFQDILKVSRQNSIILSVLIAAVLFSAHHHIFFVNGQFHTGEPFSVSKFIFRTIAGIYFAVLFAVRGFGITAGTHAFYNIIATFLNAFLFACRW